MEGIYQQLIEGLRKYFEKNNFQHAVLGLSGGIDSAVTLKLAVDALGAENVTVLIMPELNLTKEENIRHAKILAEYLNVESYYQAINSFLIEYGLLPWKQSKKASMNNKARVRMTLLYNYANTTNALVLGTSNKSESLLGYGTKYGDLAADLEVIGDLYKQDVYALAKYMSLPDEFINKEPSAELEAEQTDAKELGGSYAELDPILLKYSEGKKADEIIEAGHKPHLVRSVFQRIKENDHKTKMPPVIKVEFDNIERKTIKKPLQKPKEVKLETEILQAPETIPTKTLEKTSEIEDNKPTENQTTLF